MKRILATVPACRTHPETHLSLAGTKGHAEPALGRALWSACKVLNQAVRRNRERFPDDFMFQLDRVEFENLKSQIVTSSWGGARRARPYAFTEQGVAMLSGVLRSDRAVQVNIAVMRAFVQLRQLLG